ncbi:DDE_4 domain-containing protein [Gossypium australe]|uniref:DDE_4 domain-containing protein n=1 Tax=Gossypium australe TaxID=47621 RepID=A0A5B6WGY6_9ROSI|nr:DDE_4 domain-containing protein [Gossypium australe]
MEMLHEWKATRSVRLGMFNKCRTKVNFENETSSSKSIRRHWIDEEDRISMQFLVELYHIGNHNANCGFRKRYLPNGTIKNLNSGAKAKPHIDNMLRTLRNEWSIVHDMTGHDMIYGKHTSDFGWDGTKKVVIVEQAVWDEFLKVNL